MCVYAVYLQDETLRAGKLVIPHGFVHEQEEQAGQEGQSDENQTCDLGNNTHMNTHIYTLKANNILYFPYFQQITMKTLKTTLFWSVSQLLLYPVCSVQPQAQLFET